MKCPVDDNELLMSERQGIEIDYCPKCRGVWLDRGELDKIIDRTAESEVNEPKHISHSAHREEYNENDQHHGGKKKRGGFLSDIFEFGD